MESLDEFGILNSEFGIAAHPPDTGCSILDSGSSYPPRLNHRDTEGTESHRKFFGSEVRVGLDLRVWCQSNELSFRARRLRSAESRNPLPEDSRFPGGDPSARPSDGLGRDDSEGSLELVSISECGARHATETISPGEIISVGARHRCCLDLARVGRMQQAPGDGSDLVEESRALQWAMRRGWAGSVMITSGSFSSLQASARSMSRSWGSRPRLISAAPSGLGVGWSANPGADAPG